LAATRPIFESNHTALESFQPLYATVDGGCACVDCDDRSQGRHPGDNLDLSRKLAFHAIQIILCIVASSRGD